MMRASQVVHALAAIRAACRCVILPRTDPADTVRVIAAYRRCNYPPPDRPAFLALWRCPMDDDGVEKLMEDPPKPHPMSLSR